MNKVVNLKLENGKTNQGIPSMINNEITVFLLFVIFLDWAVFKIRIVIRIQKARSLADMNLLKAPSS